ncbi:MAG: hypothetical protein GYB49_09555 [Alphaproteobacteria bacterium]|nr:hypothetical protein [Alphaproteobacteria bacterium]
MTGDEVINAMLATSYERGGRGPDTWDCWGLVCEVSRLMDWPVPYDPLAHSEDVREMLRIFREHVLDEDWKLTDRQDGAVAFFGKFEAARHAGIVINSGVLHTREDTGPQWIAPEDLGGYRIEYALWDR